jgi:hypothetical protein
LLKTLRLLRYEGYYERFFGIKTMQIKKSDDEHNFHYQGASYYVLLELFKKLPVSTRTKGFIDYGSGKGRALFAAEYSGFNENVKLYSQKRAESHFSFICENALSYRIPENVAVFYFFNPFSDKIMTEVIRSISAYQLRTSENIYVIYVNPQFKDLWLKAGYDIYHTEGNSRYTEAIIFRKGVL